MLCEGVFDWSKGIADLYKQANHIAKNDNRRGPVPKKPRNIKFALDAKIAVGHLLRWLEIKVAVLYQTWARIGGIADPEARKT